MNKCILCKEKITKTDIVLSYCPDCKENIINPDKDESKLVDIDKLNDFKGVIDKYVYLVDRSTKLPKLQSKAHKAVYHFLLNITKEDNKISFNEVAVDILSESILLKAGSKNNTTANLKRIFGSLEHKGLLTRI